MSVLIKGMKLPKNGYLAIVPTGEVFISGNGWGFQSYGWSVQPDGQAVELPDHGDLVDRDEAADDACLIWGRNSSGDDAAQEIIEHLRKMKAVIPAERSEE